MEESPKWFYETLKRSSSYIFIIYYGTSKDIQITRGSIRLESKEELDKWISVISALNS